MNVNSFSLGTREKGWFGTFFRTQKFPNAFFSKAIFLNCQNHYFPNVNFSENYFSKVFSSKIFLWKVSNSESPENLKIEMIRESRCIFFLFLFGIQFLAVFGEASMKSLEKIVHHTIGTYYTRFSFRPGMAEICIMSPYVFY